MSTKIEEVVRKVGNMSIGDLTAKAGLHDVWKNLPNRGEELDALLGKKPIEETLHTHIPSWPEFCFIDRAQDQIVLNAKKLLYLGETLRKTRKLDLDLTDPIICLRLSILQASKSHDSPLELIEKEAARNKRKRITPPEINFWSLLSEEIK